MRPTIYLSTAFVLLAGTAQAQVTVRTPGPPGERRMFMTAGREDTRAVLGVGTAAGVSPRDTLGLLITSITPGGPAEKAGLEEGNRLQSVNGANLRLSRGDIDDYEMAGIMQRRLERELAKVKPGDEVELKVYAGGQTRTVRVKTADSDTLYSRDRRRGFGFGFGFGRDDEDRATLGLSVGATGSRRDTLGVFVFSVNDSGPAAKAGLEEGSRIAAINGVDLRVSPVDAGDEFVGSAKARRLQREISRIRPGDDVELRVYANGQLRTLKVKAVRASDLPRGRHSMFIGGDALMSPDIGPMPAMPLMPSTAPMPAMPRMPHMQFDFDGPQVSDDMQRLLDRLDDVRLNDQLHRLLENSEVTQHLQHLLERLNREELNDRLQRTLDHAQENVQRAIERAHWTTHS